MSKICHTHCPDESLGLGVLVLAAAVVAAGLAVILFVIKYLVVLGLGLAGIAVVTFALYRIALRFTVVRTAPPRRRLVAAPARTPAARPPPRRRRSRRRGPCTELLTNTRPSSPRTRGQPSAGCSPIIQIPPGTPCSSSASYANSRHGRACE